MSENSQNSLEAEARHAVLNALKDLRYGTVEITVHDSRVVEVTRKERQRLDAAAKPPKT